MLPDAVSAPPDRNGLGTPAHGGWPLLARLLPVLFALACFLLCLHWSWRWPLVHDAAIMHYVIFLMDHGMAPYRDIVDINMPGAYMSEWLVVHSFGGGALAWRLYDLALMLAAIAAACSIAAPWDWMAGAFAGLALGVFHMSGGAMELGQRDWAVMVLVLLGFAFLFAALRRHQPVLMAPFALAFGAAASTKPLAAPFPFALLLLAWMVLRREDRRTRPFLVWSLVGACVPLVAVAAFLFENNAFAPFLHLLHGLIPFYAGFGNSPLDVLLKAAVGRFLLGLTVLALFVSLLRGSWKRWETSAVALGVAFGLFLYLGQRKGFAQHKATLMAFVLLWIATQSYYGLQRRHPTAWLASATLLLCSLWIAHHWLPAVRTARYHEASMLSLQHQLEALGGPALNGQVQCIEMVQGCINDLYRMRLVQSTGYLSDFFLFRPERLPVLDPLRRRLLAELTRRPPEVIVIEAFGWEEPAFNYTGLQNWPEFAAFLDRRYTLSTERRAPDGSIDRTSYRLYLLR